MFLACSQMLLGQAITAPTDDSSYPFNTGLITLTATPASGTFSGTGVMDLGSGNGTFNTNQALGDYVITYSKVGGGAFTVTITVHIVAAGAVTFNPPTPVCLTYPVIDLTLYASPAGGSFSGTGVIGTDFDPSFAGLGTHTLTYTPLVGAPVNADITVEPQFTAILTAGGATTFCDGGNVNLSADPVDGDSYSWYQNGVLIATALGNSYTATASGNYYVDITRSNCTETSNTISVTVNPLPVNKVITATNYCAGAAAGTITVPLSELGVNYQIYTDPGNAIYKTAKIGTGADLTWTTVAAGSYKILATKGTCTLTTNIVTVVANPLPTFVPSVSADDATLCSGSSTQLHANAVSAAGISTYTWNNSATLDDEFLEDPVATPLNSTTYTVTVVDNNSCTSSQGVTVIVNPTPNVTISPVTSFTICEGNTISLRGESNPNAATWSWDGGVFSGVGNPPTDYVYAPASSTAVTLDVVDVNGCSGSATANVTVNKTPTANAGPDREMCDGIGTILDASASTSPLPSVITSYDWSNATSGVTTSVNPSSTTIYTVTVTNNLGCTDVSSVTVTFLSNPTMSLTSSNAPTHSICNGESIDLTANPILTPNGAITNYNWLPGGLSLQTVTVSPPNAVLGAAPATQIYIATITDTKGCKATGNITVTTFSQSPITIPIDGNQYCKNPPNIQLQATPVPTSGFGVGPNTAEWTSTTALFIENDDEFDPTAWTSAIYNINYRYTNGWGCSNDVDATVEILNYATPVVSFVQPLNGDVFCNDGSPAVEVLTSDGMGAEAYITRTLGGVTTDDGDGTGWFDATAEGIGNYTLTYNVVVGTTGTGCTAGASINITVGDPVTITPINDMCVGDADQPLALTPAGTGVGTWDITFNPDGVNPTTNVSYPDNSALAFLEANEAGEYSVDYISGGSCSNTTTTVVRVEALPVLDFDIGSFDSQDGGINFCNNIAPVGLVSTPFGGSFTSNPAGNVNPATFDPATTGPGTFTLTYTYTDGNGCVNSLTSNNVEVNAAPVVDITGLNAAYCNDEAAFTVTGDPTSGTLGFGTFIFPGAWTPGVEAIDNGDGTAEIDPLAINPTGTFNITYSVDDLNGCTGTITEPFAINPLPTVDFNGIPASGEICKNAVPITLTGSPTDANGVFTVIPGLTDNGDGTATFDPDVATVTVGIHTITYTYTNIATSCINTISKNIDVLDIPLQYSVIDPGGSDYCEGGVGVQLGVTNSQNTFTYRLIRNGTTTVQTTNSGADGAFTFPGTYTNGVYTVTAVHPTTGCEVDFLNSITVTEIPAIDDAGPIAGPIAICADGTTTYTYTVAAIGNAASYNWVLPANVTLVADGGNTIDVTFDPAFITGNITVNGADIANLVCPTGVSSSITVTRNLIPSVVGVPSISGYPLVCEGTTAVIYSILSTDFNDETTYEWEIAAGAATIPGAITGTSVSVDFPLLSVDGYIRVRGVNACGESNWVTLNITVQPAPDVRINTLINGSQNSCSGTSVTLTAIGAVSYVWNTGALVDNITISPTITTVYTVTGTDVDGCEASTTYTINVDPLPTAYNVTGGGTYCSGDPGLPINIFDTDLGVTYELYLNGLTTGLTLPGTGNLITFVNQTAPGIYTVIGTDDVTSCENTMTGSQTISISPTSVGGFVSGGTTICSGATSGALTLAGETGTIQGWQYSTVAVPGPGDWINIASIANPYTSGALIATTHFRAVVRSGVCPDAYSASTTVTVNDPILITSQPTDINTCLGSNVAFSVAATGTALTYQWYGPGAVLIPGETSSSLAINGVAAGDVGSYYCEVTNSCSATVPTVTVNLNLLTTTAITTDLPVPTISLCEGEDYNLNIGVQGDNLTYEWYKGGVLVSDGGVYSNATTANLTLTGVTATESDSYFVIVRGTCGDVTSASATIDVKQPVVFTTQPASQTVCSGSNHTFFVAVSGDVLATQWQVKDGFGVFNDILGETNLNYTTGTAGTYRCMVTTTDCGGPYYSAEVTLTVNPVTAITTQPVTPQNVCVNDNVSFTVVATGVGLTYQWYKNDALNPVAGATNATLNLTNVAVANAGSYFSIVTGTCGIPVTSTVSVLSIDVAPIISVHPQTKAVCAADNTNLSVSTSAGTNLTYEWYFDNGGGFVAVPASNSPILPLNAFNAAQEGDYYVDITNYCGTISSNMASVTLVNPFTLTDPTDQTVCEGNTATFTVAASEPGVTYQWRKGGVDISGAVSASYIINNVTTADEDAYSCEITNICNSLVTNSAQLTVVSNTITILSHPQDKTKCLGDIFNLNASASTTTGEVLTYQWYKAPAVALTTGTTLDFNPFAVGDDGTYYCEVTNGCATKQTNSAVVTEGVDAASVIADPTTVNECVDEDVTFTVGALQAGFTYQWSKDGVDLIDDSRVSGSISNVLSINNIQLSDDASYSCIVMGTCGTPATTAGAQLNVQAPPTITTGKNPIAATACVGSDATFSVEAEGTSLIYQWQKDGVDINIIANPTAATSTLQLTSVVVGDAGLYRCVVSNTSCVPINSSDAELTVLDDIVINSHPVSQEVCANSNTTFEFDITAPVGATYQWYKGLVALSNDARISGVSLPTLTINNAVTADNGSYWCDVISPCGNTQSNPALLTVRDPIAITQHPQSDVVCDLGTLALNVQSTGTVNTYQWYFDNGGGPVTVGTNSPTYNTVFAPALAGSYYCDLTNVCGTRTSDMAVITAGEATNVSISADVEQCVGTSTNFTVTPITGTNLNYQWYLGADALTDGVRISGSTTASLNINNLVTADAGIYKCFVTGACGDVQPDALLTVNQPITITTQPRDRAVCEGLPASFFVVASGTNPLYQWFDGFGPLAGETSSTLTLLAVDPTDAGQYYCEVTNFCGTVTTTMANLTVYEQVTVDVDPVPVDACQAQTVNFSITTSGTVVSYQWLKDGQPLSNGGSISGADAQTLVIANVALANAGQYSCEVYSGCNTQTSAQAQLNVSVPIVITQHPISTTRCGTPVNLTVFATGNNLTYQWFFDNGGGFASIPGANTSIYNANAAGDYRAEVSNGCGVTTTNIATITDGLDTDVTISGNLTQCEGTDAQFIITVISGTNLTYQWYKGSTLLADGGQINGSNTSTLTVSGIATANAGTYQSVVTGTCGTESDLYATLTVQENVDIQIQPVSTSVLEGNTATLKVIATGEIVSYKWRHNGTPINDVGNYSGTNTSTLTVSNAAPADVGTYSCLIVGTCIDVLSSSADLSVIATTVITQHPLDATKCEGETLALSVEPNSGYTYQWKRGNTSLVNDARISGATTSSLNISSVTVADQGAYTCIVGTEISQPAVVVVNPSITITENPIDVTKCEGDSHTFSVNATGNVTAYNWYRSDDPLTSISTLREYTINPLTPGDENEYFAIVSGTCGLLPVDRTSSIAELVVNVNPIITAQPAASPPVCQNGSISLEITAIGDDLTYLWYKDGAPITETNVLGKTTNRIDISNAQAANGGIYSCIVSSPCGSPITSNLSTLIVNPTTVINTHPIGRTKCEGDDVTFTVAAQGGNLTYDWTLDNVSLGLPSSPSLTITNLDKITHEGIYRCIVTGTCGTITTNPAVLTIKRLTTITTPAADATQTICQNSSITFTIAATGDDLAYQWTKNGDAISDGGNISGTQTSVLNISTAQLSDAGAYSCDVTGYCGSTQPSYLFNLVVNPLTAITLQPISRTTCEGSDVVFNVTATGSNLIYQWHNSLIGPIPLANSATLTLPSVSKAAHEGNYWCVVSGDCPLGSDISSNVAVLTINETTGIDVQPVIANPILCEGAATTITIEASGYNLSYQWKKDGAAITATNFEGVDTNVLEITNANVSDAGVYTCTLTGGCGSNLTSAGVTLSVNPTTILSTQPIGRDKCEGTDVTFTVFATGSNVAYQWYKGITPLANVGTVSGATSNQLSITNLTTGDAGSYTCQITADCGDITSEIALLNVYRNTSITVQPVIGNATLCEGESTTITISATGDNLVYLWKKNGQPIVDANITGIDADVLDISNATPDNAGDYTCTVTGSCGPLRTSNVVTLTVNPTTAITVNPLGADRCEGDQVTFSVTAVGSGITYTWYKNSATSPAIINETLASGAIITGATTNQLRITGLTPAESGSYICEVDGTCQDDLLTIPATLTVSGLVQIGTEPPSLTTLCQGSSADIEVVATGTILEYKWKKDNVYISDNGTISGTSTAILSISNALTTDAGFYSCEIVGTCNTTETQLAQVVVNPIPAITKQPLGGAICEGDNIQMFVEATGTNPLSYQWKLNNTDIPLATTSTLTINNIEPVDAGAYTVMVSGASCGNIISNTATVVVNPKISITVQPANAEVCEDNSAIFTLNATGTGSLSYIWKLDDVPLVNDGRITGVNTNQLTIALATPADMGIYKAELSSTCGIIESNSATLTVFDSTKITSHPQSQSVLLGLTANFNISAIGVNSTYQWQKDNVDIPGAQSSSFSIASVVSADAGVYRCIVTGNCGSVISNIAILTVNLPVTITGPQPIPPVCAGQSAQFSVVATGSIVSYQWKFNGGNLTNGSGISGATSPNLVISAVNLSHAGSYSCVVTGTNNIANSDVVTLTVNSLATITSQPLSQTLCNGNILVLEVGPNDPTLTYTWELDGAPLPADPRISGTSTSKLVITNISNTDAGSYRCTISNICVSEISNPAIVTIEPVVMITSEPENLTQCEGQTAFFSVVANVSNVSYKWYKNGNQISNGVNITGATTANLIINNLTTEDAGNYSCRIDDSCTYDNSAFAILTVIGRTIIQSQPVDMAVCNGDAGYFEVMAIPDGLTYQWQKNGVNIPADIAGYISGTHTNVLSILGVSQTDVGVYRCVITGGCNDEITNPSSLTVNEYPADAGAISGLQTVCQGSTNVFYVVPEIANAETYVWDVPYGATIVNGEGTRSIQVDYGNDALVDVITVYGQNSCGNGAISTPLPITVNPLPVAFAGIDNAVCGTSIQLSANQTTGGTWHIVNGDGVFENASLYNTSVNLLNKGINTFKWTVTQNGCTSSDEVIITNLLVEVNAGPDQVICSRNTQFEAQTPLSGASWRVFQGQGTIVTPSSPTSLVTGLNQDLNVFGWQVNNEGCISTDTVSITNNRPFAPEAGEDQIIAFQETDLNAMEPEDGTIGFWELLSGGGSFVDPTDPKTKIIDLMPGPNTIVWTVQRENCTLSDTVVVENILLEPANAGVDQTICTDVTTISAKVPNIGTGEWSVIIGAANFDNINSPTTKVTNLGHGENILRWTVRTSIIGVTWDEVSILNNKPTQADAGTDITLCTNQTNLAGNNSVYGIGVWTLLSGSGNIADTSDAESLITDLGSGSNILKWTINNNGCISDDFVSIINSTPTTADAGSDQVICFDSTSLFPNTPTYGVGSWSRISGAATFNGNIVTKLGPDQNVLRYTITQGTCKSFDDITITNNKPTTPAAGYDQKICVNSVVLDANPALQGTGEWTVQSGSGVFSDSSDSKAVVTDISGGLNIYRWTITKNGCSELDEVFVNNDFVLATAGSDIDLCENEYQLLASNPNPGIGTWNVVGSSGAVFSNPNDPNSLVTNLSNGANQLRWMVKNGNCVSSDIVVVGSYKPTDALAGENQSVCGKQTDLRANTPVYGEGLWILMSGIGIFDDETDPKTTIRNLGVGKNVLRWMITDHDCSSYDETIITSNLPVDVFGGNDQVVCSDTAVLSANPPTIGTGRWSIISGSGSFDDPSNYQTVVRFLGKGQNKLQWKVSSSDCHVPDTVIITSSIPTKAVAGADQILCADSTLMAANTPSVGAGEWIMVSGSAAIESINDPESKITSIGLGKTTLRWTISLDGCYSFDEVTLTNNQPSKPFAGYDVDICGDSVRLFAEPVEIGTGVWSLVSGDAVIVTPDSNQTQVNKIKFNENTFRWTVTNLNCTLHDDIVVTSNYEYVNAGEDRQVNTPDIQLIGNKPAQGIGRWEVSASPATIEDAGNFETMVRGLGSGANVFTWTITNDDCTSSDNIVINYIVMPVADFEPSSTNGCPPLSVNFVNTTIGGIGSSPYTWDFGDGETSTEHSIIHEYEEPGVYNAVLTVTAPLGLTVVKDTLITVYENPVADFDIAPKKIYTPGQHISCFNYSKRVVSSIWYFGDGTSITEYAPTYDYKGKEAEEGIYDIALTVISDKGCTDSLLLLDAVEVIKSSEFKFPEAFTPNPFGGSGGTYDPEDRSNNVFYPMVINGELLEFEMLIYNRSGVLVFKTTDVAIGWDGYYKHKLLPQDVYVFIVRGRYNSGQPFQETGNVLLIIKDN